MAKTLQEMLGYVAQTGIIQSPKGGIPDNILPAEFHRVTRRIKGDQFKFKLVAGNRKLAKRVNRGDPSVNVESGIVGERQATLAFVYEHIMHEAELLEALTAYDNPVVQSFGQAEVDRKTVEFRQRLNNWRLAMVYSALANGKIWFDGSGNLLPSASGAVVTIDFERPDAGAGVGCRGYIEHNADNRIIDGTADQKWSTATTDIPGHMEELVYKAALYTGYPLVYAFYGKNVPTYLLNNTAVSKLFPVGSPLLATLAQGNIPGNFLQITQWIPVNSAFFEDASGTIQKFFNDDKVVFTPRPDSTWWDVVEGSFPIPTQLGKVSTDTQQAGAGFKSVNGMFSYATPKDDPPGIKHFLGDTFGCFQKVTKAIFEATVHW